MIEDKNELLHQEHLLWINELNFIQDEIKHFQNRLAQVLVNKRKDDDFVKDVSYYRKKCLEILNEVDEHRFTIATYEQHLAEREELNNRLKIRIPEDHHTEKEKIRLFLGNYEDLKKEINDFISNNL